MIVRTPVVLIAVLASAGAPVSAQNVDAAIASAYRHDQTLKASEAACAVAAVRLRGARSARLPSVTLRGEGGYRYAETNRFDVLEELGQGILDDDDIRDTLDVDLDDLDPEDLGFAVGPQTILSAEVRIDQPIYEGGTISSRIDAAQKRLGAARAELSATGSDLALEVVTLLTDLQYHDALIENRKQILATIETQEKAVMQRRDDGSLTPGELRNAVAATAHAEARLAAAMAEHRALTLDLKNLTGLDVDAVVTNVRAPNLPPDLESAQVEAARNSPELEALRLESAAARHDTAAARGRLRPQIGLSGRVGHRSIEPQGFAEDEAAALVQISLPIFRTGLREAVDEARLLQKRANHREQGAVARLYRDVSRAWGRHLAARSLLEAEQATVETARLAHRDAQESVRLGVLTFSDILEEETALFEAEIALARAERDSLVADYRLAHLTDATARSAPSECR